MKRFPLIAAILLSLAAMLVCACGILPPDTGGLGIAPWKTTTTRSTTTTTAPIIATASATVPPVAGESTANIKALAVAGKELAWCLNPGNPTPWGTVIAQYNPKGWLPAKHAQSFGFGGRNGVLIEKDIIVASNHLGWYEGQTCDLLAADGSVSRRKVVKSAQLVSASGALIDCRVARLETVPADMIIAPLITTGVNPKGAYAVRSGKLKQALVVQIGSTSGTACSYTSRPSAFLNFSASPITGDSSGGVILITNSGPVAAGVVTTTSTFIPFWTPEVRGPLEKAIAAVKQP